MKNNDILYEKFPARIWAERFPLGNGNIGAMDDGGIERENISLNDDTLWSGNGSLKPLPESKIDEIRKLTFEGKTAQAEDLAWHNLLGEWTDAYMPLSDLIIEREISASSSYSRRLNMADALLTVTDGNLTATSFVSHPDRAYVMRQSGYTGVSKISADCPLKHSVNIMDSSSGAEIIVSGIAPDYAAPSYHPDDDPIRYNGGGTRFTLAVCIIGDTSCRDGKVIVKGDFLITASSATSYSCDKDLEETALSYARAAASQGWERLLQAHTSDFGALYNRVKIDLGAKDDGNPLSKQFKSKKYKLCLTEKLFNLGRYLMISSSRSGTQAANLQGIWNPHLRAPWSSNYTTNINTEMNYWNVEALNLSECHEPLFDLISKAHSKGKRSAREQFKCGGWVLGQNCDMWGHSDCVGGRSHYPPCAFGLFVGGSGWLVSHLWERYLFTLDKDFVAGKIDIIKDAARFYLDYVTEKDGVLYPCPSTSPENVYSHRGVHSLDTATACDISIIANTWDIAAKACELLGQDAEFASECRDAIEKLPPIKTYMLGVQEYSKPYMQVDIHHRHLSHLIGLFPFSRISVEDTPTLAKACDRTLKVRGGAGTGWSLAWKINLFARLKNGKKAYKMIRRQLRAVGSAKLNMHSGGSFISLLCAHPPFQIDGNFGAASGICEMLLSSYREGTVQLLPALPKEWRNGSFSGLKARGGITVDCAWKDGVITGYRLRSEYNRTIKLVTDQGAQDISLSPAQDVVYGDMQ